MRRALLVTAREYRRMMKLPAFWVVSLIVPLFVLAVPVESRFLRKMQTVGYVLVDKSGSYAQQINRRVELDYQRQVLGQLLAYFQEWRAGSPAAGEAALPEAGSSGSSASDAVVQNFVATGGAPAIVRLMKSRMLPGAPAFEAPPRPLVEIPLPDGVATDTAERFGASIGPHFGETSRTQAGLGVAVYIPENVDSGGQARVWTEGPASAALVQDLRRELTGSLRLKALRAAGVDALSAAQIETLNAPVTIGPAQTATPGSKGIIRSALPLALAGLLMISTMITGSMMLQGLVEERSNKLLEAVLACVSPRELMVGKLLGIWAIGLTIVGIWIGATMGVARAVPSSPLGFLVPALASLGQTPWMVASMIFYFLAGYLTLGMIFLVVGVLSDSMQEAQAYLTPLMFLIVAPAAGLGSVIFRDPNGLLPHIFSWIPLYTPVTMLARLQSGVSSFEILGTSAALLVFGALELWLLGRLFENHLIASGGGFHLTREARRMALRGAIVIVVLGVVAVRFQLRHSHTPAPEADQTASLHAQGEKVFKASCAKCHGPAAGQAQSRGQARETLAALTPEEVVATLTSGTMKPMAAGLSDADIRAVATYLTGRQPKLSPLANADPPACSQSAFSMAGGGWNGWSIDPRNGRFQSGPGLAAADIPRLKVKWALSYTGGEYGQPTVAGGRLFLTSMGGAIYSLDAKTGCMYWRFAQSVASRTTVSVGPLPGVAPSGYAAYFGEDFIANVYAVDAASGALLWKTQVDAHPRAMLTGAPVLYKGRLYVPVSSREEGVATLADYSCCTFRGSVVALDAATGKVVWKAFAIDHAPAPTIKNSAGTGMYGPAGAAVWSAPTIDARSDRLYFATGNSYTSVKEGGSDAVVAVDLESGRTVWRRQVTENDNDLSGCASGRKLVNCPTPRGHDYDFGASPILAPRSNGKDILVAGQKSGVVYGIDPGSGEILWRTHVGVGGILGGVEWGMASDGTRLYVANADVLAAQGGRPGLFALDLSTGKDLWYAPSPRVACSWSGAPCFNAQSAAPSAIPGVVFSGTTDGHERAYASADGRVLWDFDTAGHAYRTINGVPDQAGGSIDVTSGVIAEGMLYLISGYRGTLGGGVDDVLLAFSIDGR